MAASFCFPDRSLRLSMQHNRQKLTRQLTRTQLSIYLDSMPVTFPKAVQVILPYMHLPHFHVTDGKMRWKAIACLKSPYGFIDEWKLERVTVLGGGSPITGP